MKQRVNGARILDNVREIAYEGIHYAQTPFDSARYKKLAEVVEDLYRLIPRLQMVDVSERFKKDLGVVTAKVGVDMAIVNRSGQILLHRRVDDGAWGLPGGWVQPTETVEEAGVREAFEETGLRVAITHLISTSSQTAHFPNRPHSSCHVLFLARRLAGRLRISEESTDLGFRYIEDVSTWHRDHRKLAKLAIEFASK